MFDGLADNQRRCCPIFGKLNYGNTRSYPMTIGMSIGYMRMPPKKNILSNSSSRASEGGPIMGELLDLLRQQSNQMAQQQEQFQQQQFLQQ
ncbi:hypothetical protein AgCh_021436 [Apium graveolens]